MARSFREEMMDTVRKDKKAYVMWVEMERDAVCAERHSYPFIPRRK